MRILITAGPTWVAIDGVRVISNTATGETGILLAEELQKKGCRVTLILGPVEACCINKRIAVIRFKFFDELAKLVKAELSGNNYDWLIHSAAVSDYKPGTLCRSKIRSGLTELNLRLKPTPKIINSIKRINPGIKLAGFKFEPQAPKEKLIKEAKSLLIKSKSDLVIANTTGKSGYRAYIVKKDACLGPFNRKSILVNKLTCLISNT